MSNNEYKLAQLKKAGAFPKNHNPPKPKFAIRTRYVVLTILVLLSSLTLYLHVQGDNTNTNVLSNEFLRGTNKVVKYRQNKTAGQNNPGSLFGKAEEEKSIEDQPLSLIIKDRTTDTVSVKTTTSNLEPTGAPTAIAGSDKVSRSRHSYEVKAQEKETSTTSTSLLETVTHVPIIKKDSLSQTEKIKLPLQTVTSLPTVSSKEKVASSGTAVQTSKTPESAVRADEKALVLTPPITLSKSKGTNPLPVVVESNTALKSVTVSAGTGTGRDKVEMTVDESKDKDIPLPLPETNSNNEINNQNNNNSSSISSVKNGHGNTKVNESVSGSINIDLSDTKPDALPLPPSLHLSPPLPQRLPPPILASNISKPQEEEEGDDYYLDDKGLDEKTAKTDLSKKTDLNGAKSITTAITDTDTSASVSTDSKTISKSESEVVTPPIVKISMPIISGNIDSVKTDSVKVDSVDKREKVAIKTDSKTVSSVVLDGTIKLEKENVNLTENLKTDIKGNVVRSDIIKVEEKGVQMTVKNTDAGATSKLNIKDSVVKLMEKKAEELKTVTAKNAIKENANKNNEKKVEIVVEENTKEPVIHHPHIVKLIAEHGFMMMPTMEELHDNLKSGDPSKAVKNGGEIIVIKNQEKKDVLPVTVVNTNIETDREKKMKSDAETEKRTNIDTNTEIKTKVQTAKTVKDDVNEKVKTVSVPVSTKSIEDSNIEDLKKIAELEKTEDLINGKVDKSLKLEPQRAVTVVPKIVKEAVQLPGGVSTGNLNSVACSGTVDPFLGQPVDNFIPPVNALLKEKMEWKSAVDAMLLRVSRMKIGGEKLRSAIKDEVAILQLLRIKLFCQYV